MQDLILILAWFLVGILSYKFWRKNNKEIYLEGIPEVFGVFGPLTFPFMVLFTIADKKRKGN